MKKLLAVSLLTLGLGLSFSHASQAASVSGLKKWKISRERGAGSALSVKRMIWPVASNRKRSGVLSLRHLRLAVA